MCKFYQSFLVAGFLLDYFKEYAKIYVDVERIRVCVCVVFFIAFQVSFAWHFAGSVVYTETRISSSTLS